MKNRLLGWVAAGAVTVLALSACGGSNSGNTTPNAAPTDKVLHLSFLQDPGQPPDPDIYYAGQGLLLTTNTYEGLLQYKAGTEKPELEPLLATEWTASPDNKVFTFKLREGVKFHDGTPLTSAAVKASFDRRLAVNQGPAYMVKDVDSVTTQGDYGVTVTLKAPNSAFLDYLACPYGPRMLSPEGLKKNAGTDNAQNYLTTHDLGTGPFTLTDAQVGSHYGLAGAVLSRQQVVRELLDADDDVELPLPQPAQGDADRRQESQRRDAGRRPRRIGQADLLRARPGRWPDLPAEHDGTAVRETVGDA
jgi:peptide/nickel transport system substrate-binding protein